MAFARARPHYGRLDTEDEDGVYHMASRTSEPAPVFGPMASPPPSAPSSKFVFNDARSPDPHRSTFRSSVGLIPTPGVHEQKTPKYEPIVLRLWVVLLGALLLVAIGIGLEVALSISENNNGFAVPDKNVFANLGVTSSQTLTRFFPVLFVTPLFWLVISFDWQILVYQPYVMLSRGNKSAEESIMLQYAGIDFYHLARQAMKFRHWLVLASLSTVVASWTFQPLAGSILEVVYLPMAEESTVTSQRAVGLNPATFDLTAWEAAAGYAEAAVYNVLADPPFVFNGYSTAQFAFPNNQYLNGSMQVNTTAVRTNLQCSSPIHMDLVTTDPSNFTLTATSKEGCTLGPVSFNPSDANQRYNVTTVPNCAALPETDPEFQPVFFWFWQAASLATGGGNNSAGVFCVPSLQLFDVLANASLASGFLTDVTPVDDYPLPNNVTSGWLAGRAFNGLIFNASTDINVNARAQAIRTGIPNAIFRSAVQDPRGLQAVFDDANGFVDKTNTTYTRHLALAATSVYFLPTQKTVPALLSQLKPRLVIVRIPTHILAVISFVTGLALIAIHVLHYRLRRDVYLPMPPGCLGLTIGQSTRAGFGQLLYPYDSREQMLAKLSGLRFALDRRTGAVVVDDGSVYDAGRAWEREGDDYAFRAMEEKDGTKVYSVLGGGRLGGIKEEANTSARSSAEAEAVSPPPTAAQERMPFVGHETA